MVHSCFGGNEKLQVLSISVRVWIDIPYLEVETTLCLMVLVRMMTTR